MRIYVPLILSAVLMTAGSFLAGCEPCVERRKVIATFNQLPEIIERDGHVEDLMRFEREDGGVFIVEAEIVNADGEPIGRLRSERVEGWGTRKPRIQWYKTPGVSEEWNMPSRRGRRGQRGPGDRDRPNQGGNSQERPPETPQ